jgi:1,4-dihydroxy-2-naphthoate octaprenyltransferase
MSRAAIAHLRFPFSLFLMPIYLSALAASSRVLVPRAIASFLIVHLLLYPASNGFNSYYDRDEGPIGGLAHPPPVDRSLLILSLLLDALALLAGFAFLGLPFFLGILLYGTASKLYSWDRTRIKARPFAGWLLTGIGQGGITFLIVLVSVDARGLGAIAQRSLLYAFALTFILLGIFPLTQVYQHEEDRRRGDLTISRLLGIRGSFLLSGACLGLGLIGLGALIGAESGWPWLLAFAAASAIPGAFFLLWLRRCLRDEGAADFARAARMSSLASASLNLFYLAYLAIERLGHFRW